MFISEIVCPFSFAWHKKAQFWACRPTLPDHAVKQDGLISFHQFYRTFHSKLSDGEFDGWLIEREAERFNPTPPIDTAKTKPETYKVSSRPHNEENLKQNERPTMNEHTEISVKQNN